MIPFHTQKCPQKLNCVSSLPGISDHVAPLLNLFYMTVRTFVPMFDVRFEGKTRVKVHKESSASFPCWKRSTEIELRAIPPPGSSDHVALLLNLFCIPIRTFVPNLVLVTIIPLSDRTNSGVKR